MKHYEGTELVRRLLRRLDDAELESVYVQGLREQKRGGPSDGDVDRSRHLRSLVEDEIDCRIEEGPQVCRG